MDSHVYTCTYDRANLSGVDDKSDVDVSGGGELPELCDSHVLNGVAVKGGVVRGPQHKLQVFYYDVLDVVHVHRVIHRLGAEKRYSAHSIVAGGTQ